MAGSKSFHFLDKIKKKLQKPEAFCFVLGAGLEPARTQCSLDFKSNVSTNSTTRAYSK